MIIILFRHVFFNNSDGSREKASGQQGKQCSRPSDFAHGHGEQMLLRGSCVTYSLSKTLNPAWKVSRALKGGERGGEGRECYGSAREGLGLTRERFRERERERERFSWGEDPAHCQHSHRFPLLVVGLLPLTSS